MSNVRSLRDPHTLEQLDSEQLALLYKLNLQKLRELFAERLREQEARHDGGNRMIGTGGTSPFGHNGKHPYGIRVSGTGVRVPQPREHLCQNVLRRFNPPEHFLKGKIISVIMPNIFDK